MASPFVVTLQALLNVTGNDLLNQMYYAASTNGNASTLNTLDVSSHLCIFSQLKFCLHDVLQLL